MEVQAAPGISVTRLSCVHSCILSVNDWLGLEVAAFLASATVCL